MAEKNALLYPNRPAWDVPKMSRFGDSTLTPEMIWGSMKGFNEPMTSVYFNILMFVSLSYVTPLLAPNEPPLLDGLLFVLPAVVDGLPWWAFKGILQTVIPMLVLLFAISKIPTNFPIEDEATLAKKGVDVDTVMLTPKELGRRISYDAPNTLVQRRRSSISDTMSEMGIKYSKSPETAVEEPSSNQKRLSSLVYSSDLQDVIEELDDSENSGEK